VAGVFTGEVLFEGLMEGLRLAQDGIREMTNLFKEASMAAAEMDLKVRGIGNLFRDPAFAKGLSAQLQTMAYKSPFQLMDLIDAAQRLSGFGVKKEDMLGTIKDLGNIVAGVGGGKPEMDRAALAYGEAITSETLTTREINQMTQLGVPVWAALEKLTGKTNQELHKMIEKHELSSSYMTRVIEDLTHGDGLFANAMENFSETFIGLLTTFQDRVSLAVRELGDFFNVFTSAFLKWIDNAPLWEGLNTWFIQLKDRAQAILTYLPTMFERMDLMPKMEAIGARIGGVIKKLFGGFDINEMFKSVTIPSTGNIEEVLTAKGNVWVDSMQKFIDPIIKLIDELVTLAGNPMVVYSLQSVAMAFKDITSMMTEFAAYLGDLGTVMHGVLTGNLAEISKGTAKFGTDITKYEGSTGLHAESFVTPEARFSQAQQRLSMDKLAGVSEEQIAKDRAELEAAKKALEAAKKQTDQINLQSLAITTATTLLNQMNAAISSVAAGLSQMQGGMFGAMTGAGLTNLTDKSGGLAVREEYDWEGHSSQYGPEGNRLKTGPYVGLNPQEMRKYNVKMGDYVLTEAGWLKIQESASRPGTIEFHADRPGQFQDKFSHLHILGTRPGGSASINVNYNPTIHHTGDAHQFASLLQDHAQHIARLVADVYQSQWERTAAV
jgi:tape measure domain-containing protein